LEILTQYSVKLAAASRAASDRPASQALAGTRDANVKSWLLRVLAPTTQTVYEGGWFSST
jgi:ubiquitin-protein ligase